MADYCSLSDVKDELGLSGTEHDTKLGNMITQVKTFINDFCHRSFDTENTTKYYDGAGKQLFIDDLLTVTTLKLDLDGDGTFEETLAATDYLLYPLNKNPKTMIKLSPNSSYSNFASGIEKGVEIAGSWGYDTSVPAPITRAAIIQVCRWFKRKDSAFSDVVGTAEMGQIIMYKGLDPDVKLLLQKYVKAVFA